MIAKKYRLTTKDIHYILKRGYRHKGQLFVFLTIPQYTQRPYHQRSLSVPVTLDKRATVRNTIKRSFFAFIEELYALDNKLYHGYQKIFVYFNKYPTNLSAPHPVASRAKQSDLQPNKKNADQLDSIVTTMREELAWFIKKQS